MDYWIAIDKKKIGPLSLSDVRSRRLDPETLVWHNGLATWCKASTLPELAGSLAGESENAEGGSGSAAEDHAQAPVFNMPEVPTRAAGPISSRPSYLESRGPVEIPDRPTTYLGWSIAAIILCCMPPAIVALVYSLKVSSKYNEGDYAGAQKASERAEIWLIVAIVAGLVWMPFSMVLGLF